MFQLLGPDGEPTTCEKTIFLWFLTDKGLLVRNMHNPVDITGHEVWFKPPQENWKGFGVSFMSTDEPNKIFPIAKYDLHVLGIPLKGGIIHEVVR